MRHAEDALCDTRVRTHASEQMRSVARGERGGMWGHISDAMDQSDNHK